MLIASLIILQVAIFAGLIYMLRKIMTQNVVLATRHLDELNQDYSKKEDEVNRKLEQVQRDSMDIMAKAQEEAVKIKEQILKEAETQKEELLKQAHQQSQEMIEQADKARQALLAEMDERVSKEAINKACELINYTLPEKFKQDVHTHWVEELVESGLSRIERLHVPEDINEVKVTSAFDLTESQRRMLAKKIKDIFGREISLREEKDPNVCVGLIISIGSLVLDGSLKNKIQEQVRNAQRAK
ncbi:MAG: F0F1 ATP synthase subunit delta [Deltaproteobacteria bacterium]